MNVYPVPSCAASLTADGGEEVPGGGPLMVAVRLGDVVSPLRNGRPLAEGDRSALVIGGTERVRTGDVTVFCKVVAVASARVRRDGRVQAQGSPVHHSTLGPLEDWLEEKAGPGVTGGIADRAVLREEHVKGERERLLARAFMIRVLVLMTLVPGAGIRDVIITLAGDLVLGGAQDCDGMGGLAALGVPMGDTGWWCGGGFRWRRHLADEVTAWWLFRVAGVADVLGRPVGVALFGVCRHGGRDGSGAALPVLFGEDPGRAAG